MKRLDFLVKCPFLDGKVIPIGNCVHICKKYFIRKTEDQIICNHPEINKKFLQKQDFIKKEKEIDKKDLEKLAKHERKMEKIMKKIKDKRYLEQIERMFGQDPQLTREIEKIQKKIDKLERDEPE